MPSEDTDRIAILQGTLDLIVLRMLQTMGRQHAYAIATRLQQVSEDLLQLNQGTLYPALVRLEQQGRIKGTWGKTESNREAKFYSITKAGRESSGAGNAALAPDGRVGRQVAVRRSLIHAPILCARLQTSSEAETQNANWHARLSPILAMLQEEFRERADCLQTRRSWRPAAATEVWSRQRNFIARHVPLMDRASGSKDVRYGAETCCGHPDLPPSR